MSLSEPQSSRGVHAQAVEAKLLSVLYTLAAACCARCAQGCLEWDPELRMTPDQALAHGWITRGAAPSPEPASLSRMGLYRQTSDFSANSAVPLAAGAQHFAIRPL